MLNLITLIPKDVFMKLASFIIGLALIIFGIFTLAYRGYSYTTQDKIAEIGSLKITAEKENTVYFPPVLGGLSIVAGIVLVVVSRSGRFK